MSCGCNNCRGLGGIETTPDFNVNLRDDEQILFNFIVGEINSKGRFYVSPTLNSDLDGIGSNFWDQITSTADSVASAVIGAAKVKSAAQSLFGSNKAQQPAAAQAVAAQVTPDVVAQLRAQGIILPDGTVRQMGFSTLLDSFGAPNRPYVIAGLVALAALLVLRR